MVNYQKTEQVWNNEPNRHPKVNYEKPPEQKGYEIWLQKLTNRYKCHYLYRSPHYSKLPRIWP
jgi:hypothetical protein